MCSMTIQTFSTIWILTEIIPGTPKHGLLKAFISTYFEPKLRLKPRPILFWLLHENCRFCPVYGYLITIMRLRTSKIGIHVAFIYSHVATKFNYFALTVPVFQS